MKVRKNFMDKQGKKSKTSNMPKSKSGKLTKDGLVYRNDLLDVDYTSPTVTTRKMKGV